MLKRKVTKVISSILAVLFICMSFNGSGLTVGETKAHAESNTKTLLVGFEESISPSQSKTINIPDLSSISRMTVNNQGNVTYSVNGKDVTINVSGGLPSRTDTPTKTVSSSRTGDSSSFPSTIPYTDGGYFGTLYATGSSYVISTTTVPGDSKLAYDSRSASSVAGLPSSISYNDGVYSGTLTWESNPTYSGSMWSVTYKGTVRSASMEVKVWQQDYSGKVYGTATCYYQYSVTVIYVPVSVPTPTISLASPTPTPTHTTPTVTPTVTPTSTPTSTSTIALSPTPSPMIKALMVDPSTMTIDGLNKLGDMLKVTAIYSYGPVDVTSIVEHSSDDKSIADMDNGFVKSGTHFGTTTIRVKYLGVEGTCKVTVGYSTPIPTPTHTATPTPTKLQKPVITSPAANSIVNNGPITIKWTSVPGVDHYLFTLVNLTDNKYIAQNKNLGNTTNYPAVLEQGKRYRTCVAAANKLETDVNWAYAVEFSTSTPLPTPKITYSIADDNQVTIKWNSVPGADHYILSLVNSTNSSTQKIIVKQKTEYSLKLEAGYKYSARIAAANKDETNASWSKTVEFTMPLMLPKFAEKCLVVNGAYVNPLTAKIVNPDSLEVRSGTVCTVKVIKEKISNVSVMNAYIEKFHVNSNSGKMEIESTYKTSDWKPDGIHDFIDTSYKFNAPGTYQVYVRGWNNPQKKVGGDYAVVATNILYVTVDDTIPVVFVPGTLGCFPADECNAMVDWYKDNYDSRGMPIYCIDTPVLKQDFPRKIFNDSVNKVRNLNENNSNKISIVNGKKYYVGILDGTYDALISKLISLNYVKDKSLFLFGYDTAETSIDNNADNLKKYVDYVLKKTGAPKVNLIAHSQGTLVARKYIQESNEKKVNKFIMISPPNTGVVKSKGMLKWGDPKQYIDIPVIGTGTPPLGIQVPGLKLPTSGDLEISRYFSYYDVFSKDSKKNSSNWYYMDPENPDHPWDLKRWANKVALPVKDMAPSSNFLSSLNSPKGIESLFSSVGNGNVYVVYGKDNNKKNTVSSYNSKNEAVLGSGDNTVTLKSLSALNKYIPKNNRYIIEEGNHGNVCSNTRFLNDLSAIFK